MTLEYYFRPRMSIEFIYSREYVSLEIENTLNQYTNVGMYVHHVEPNGKNQLAEYRKYGQIIPFEFNHSYPDDLYATNKMRLEYGQDPHYLDGYPDNDDNDIYLSIGIDTVTDYSVLAVSPYTVDGNSSACKTIESYKLRSERN